MGHYAILLSQQLGRQKIVPILAQREEVIDANF